MQNTGTSGTLSYNQRMAACKFCFHPQRDAIDRQYVGGVPLRTIVRTFGGSLGGAHRHKEHVKELLRARTDVETAEHGNELLNRVETLFTQTEEILATCKAEKDFRGAVSAVGALTRILELLARLRGELQQPNAGGIHLTLNRVTNTTLNYDADPDFASMIGEATKGFSVDELMRLKRLAESSSSLCNRRATGLVIR
jgi:hypothetical protein